MAEQALDEVMAWLGFRSLDAYSAALAKEKSNIFKRANRKATWR